MAQNAIKNMIENRDTIRRIMELDSNGSMDRMLENAVNNGSFVKGEDGGRYTPKNNVLNEMSKFQRPINPNTKLPKAIVESFMKNPGTAMPLPPEMGGSVLDGFEIPQLERPLNEQKETSAQPTTQNDGSIDYSLLKSIINEAVQENVKKYMSAFAKKMLNEGVGGNQGGIKVIKLGEGLTFVDGEGNIYEAKLKFKRNIKEINE